MLIFFIAKIMVAVIAAKYFVIVTNVLVVVIANHVITIIIINESFVYLYASSTAGFHQHSQGLNNHVVPSVRCVSQQYNGHHSNSR